MWLVGCAQCSCLSFSDGDDCFLPERRSRDMQISLDGARKPNIKIIFYQS